MEIRVGKIIDVKESYFRVQSKHIQAIFLFYEIARIIGTLLEQGTGGDSERVAFLTLQELEEQAMQSVILNILKGYSLRKL